MPTKCAIALFAIGTLASIEVGCATTTSAELMPLASEQMPEHLPAPQTSAEARAYLAGSLAAMRADKPTHALLFLDAILRSDHLTERGRADVYWLSVEANRLARDEPALTEALGGFLVASAIVPSDDDMRAREIE